MNLGGSKLMLRGWLSNVDVTDTFCLWFSDDAGQTWSQPERIPLLPDGRPYWNDLCHTPAIDGDTFTGAHARSHTAQIVDAPGKAPSPVQVHDDLPLDVEVLRGRLDHEFGAGELALVRREGQVVDHRLGLVGLEGAEFMQNSATASSVCFPGTTSTSGFRSAGKK